MNLSELQTKLLEAARRSPPGDGAPYAFEKRIMSRLAGQKPESAWSLWGTSLWRGAAVCAAVTVLCGLWSFAASRSKPDTSASFSQDLELTVFASMDQSGEDAW